MTRHCLTLRSLLRPPLCSLLCPPLPHQAARQHYLSQQTLEALADMRGQFAAMLAGEWGAKGGGGHLVRAPHVRGLPMHSATHLFPCEVWHLSTCLWCSTRSLALTHTLTHALTHALTDIHLVDPASSSSSGGGGSSRGHGGGRPGGGASGWQDDRRAAWNRHADMPAMVKAVLCAALSPHVAAAAAAGADPCVRPGWLDETGAEVALHPASVNHPLTSLQLRAPYVVYLEKAQTSRVGGWSVSLSGPPELHFVQCVTGRALHAAERACDQPQDGSA